MPKGGSGKSWTDDDERKLSELVEQGVPRAVIAKTLQRTLVSIESRLQVIRSRKAPFADRED